MPFKDRITYDSIPTVQRARGILAGSDPNEAVRYLVDAAVDQARANGASADPQYACADAIVQVPTHEQVMEVLSPVGLPVAIVAEVALTAAQDAIAFIKKLQGHPGAPVLGADKYLQGLLHASTLLNGLVTNARVPGLAARLFGREMTQQQIVDELDVCSMRCVLFQMVERDEGRKERREADLPDEQDVSEYLEHAFAAALLDRVGREGTLAAVHSIFQRIDGTFDEMFRYVAQVLHEDYDALTDITHEALLDLKELATATFRSGNIDKAFQLVQCTEPLRIAADVSGILDGSLEDALHDLLREAGSQNARELTSYLSMGAFLGTIRQELDGSRYDEHLMNEAIERFGGTPSGNALAGHSSSASFWDAATERCEEDGFTQAGPIFNALQRAACVQAESMLAICGRDLCAVPFPNERTREVLLQFLTELKDLTKKRAASRYPASLDDSLPDAHIDEQRAAIVTELYEALDQRLQPVLLYRLRGCAELERLSARDEIVLWDAYRLLEEYAQQRAQVRTASRGAELLL
ncbi:MAG TPA: hypothetical protein VFE17_11180 [Candidatus Baltobacteraceae bacterium]|nr:hypothetical protein [Candidatus Baltobacteraceae bacterium]